MLRLSRPYLGTALRCIFRQQSAKFNRMLTLYCDCSVTGFRKYGFLDLHNIQKEDDYELELAPARTEEKAPIPE